MSATHLVRLTALCALLAWMVPAAQAQSTTMGTQQGYRHAGPNPLVPSSSTFAVGITTDNGATFVDAASVMDTIEIRGDMRPEEANVGQVGNIFLVDRMIDDNGQHISFSMRDQNGVWWDWDGFPDKLVPLFENVTLDASMPLTYFTGTVTVPGNHRIFTGYRSASDGILRFHPIPFPLTVTAAEPTEMPEVQARALFDARINPKIVQSSCIGCHIQGGSASNVHTFVFGNDVNAQTTNFNVMVNLENRFGKAFLMNYVASPFTAHPGAQAVFGTQNIADFDEFLTLLSQF